MLKKKIYITIVIAFLVSVSGWYVYEYNIGRYKISSPMEDIEYKKAIIRDSHNIFYKLENLRSLCGQNELANFIKENNDNPVIYSTKIENRKKGDYRANFHIHTTNSDGAMTVKDRMDEAQYYAENHIKNGYMYIAITDHNTVLGAKEVIKVLQKYPDQYKNLKVVPGMEITSLYNNSKYTDKPITIHILAWGINPYDKVLNEMFYKKDLKDKWNMSVANNDFDDVIKQMSDYALVGVAHPARYIGHLGDDVYHYIPEMFDRYTQNTSKTPFTEAYYQSYKDSEKAEIKGSFEKFSKFISQEADKRNIIKTGSTDAHGITLFRRN